MVRLTDSFHSLFETHILPWVKMECGFCYRMTIIVQYVSCSLNSKFFFLAVGINKQDSHILLKSSKFLLCSSWEKFTVKWMKRELELCHGKNLWFIEYNDLFSLINVAQIKIQILCLYLPWYFLLWSYDKFCHWIITFLNNLLSNHLVLLCSSYLDM